MRKIHKYPIKTGGHAVTRLKVPVGAFFIYAGLDPRGQACVWAEVDTEQKNELVEIHCIGTGISTDETSKAIDTGGNIGSFIEENCIWHIYATDAEGKSDDSIINDG